MSYNCALEHHHPSVSRTFPFVSYRIAVSLSPTLTVTEELQGNLKLHFALDATFLLLLLPPLSLFRFGNFSAFFQDCNSPSALSDTDGKGRPTREASGSHSVSQLFTLSSLSSFAYLRTPMRTTQFDEENVKQGKCSFTQLACFSLLSTSSSNLLIFLLYSAQYT